MGDMPEVLKPIGFMRSGLPIWPISGGDGTAGDGDAGAGDGDGDAGKKPDKGDGATEPDWKAEAEKWKGLARKHEGNAKANADAAKRLKDVEDADKSELQKAADAKAASDKRADEAELRALRLEVASEKGLTASQAKRLVGTTKEELEADADELLESFKPDKGDKKPAPGGKPKERLRGGGEPTQEPEEMDPRKLADLIPRGPH